MGKGKFWPPSWHQNLWTFSNLNLTSMITSTRSIPVKIFISIRSAGASPQMGEILRYCYFFQVGWLYRIFFLGHVPRLNLWTDFQGLWLVRPVFAQGGFFWGLRQYRNSFGVISHKNSPKRGVNRQFQAKQAEYNNRDILQSINTINVQF